MSDPTPAQLEADERLVTLVAEQLLATAFGLRPGNAERGQAWVLNLASTALARSVLASVGPTGDADAILEIAFAQVRATVGKVQSDYLRDKLMIAGGLRSVPGRPQ